MCLYNTSKIYNYKIKIRILFFATGVRTYYRTNDEEQKAVSAILDGTETTEPAESNKIATESDYVKMPKHMYFENCVVHFN